MMGRSHLMLGAASYLAVGGALPEMLGGRPLSPAQLGCGTVIACGAAMLPDLDLPQATVSRSLGPVTQSLSRVINKVAGGHRAGTHGLLAWGLVSLTFAGGLASSDGRWVALALAFLCSLMMFSTLTDAHGLVNAVLSAMTALTVISIAPGTSWMTEAIAVGYASHLLGDYVTTEGIPLLYPFRKRKHSLPLIGQTDKWRERSAGIACGLAAAGMLMVSVFLPVWQAESVAAAQASGTPHNAEVTHLRRQVSELEHRLSVAAHPVVKAAHGEINRLTHHKRPSARGVAA